MNQPSVFRINPSAVSILLLIATGASVFAQLPAFPGAQGFGRFATGGRGGTVYHVTNLNDSGAGSFRDAVSVSGRTVVFDVAGVIAYTGSRYNVAPNVTIAGQTAPGDGVVLYGDGIGFSGSHNTITRFIRFRMGINGTKDKDAVSIDNGHDMIFDHITASWGRDETFSISGSDPVNITIQSSIISQGLQGHSAGGLVQTDGAVSILRSLYIDNDTRNPKVKGVNEYVNNVVCNWETIGYNMGGDSAGESFVNVFNNYFIRGQASSSSAISGGNTDFHIYATNNWYDGNKDGVLNGSDLSFASYGSMDLKTTPYAYPISYASAYSPLTALKLAISDVGPSFRRDTVDEKMIAELTSWGLEGGTITSELIAPMNGPGPIRNGTPYTDTDQDGMPDFWENGTGSNPAVANNNTASPSGSGYTRLEDYLNWLAEPHGIAVQNTNVVVDLRQFTRGWVMVNHAPFWSVSNPTNGTVTLTNGYMALFTPTPGLNGPASFQFTVNDADGGPVTRTMNLFFTPSAQSYKAVWHGDDLTNNWNTLGDFNWHDGISLIYQFHAGEPVIFDDTGSTNPAVNLVGSLTPASVTIDAKKNFVLSGSGLLNGTMTLNKTNTGTLTINTTNTFTGATTVSNGTLLVHGALNSSPVTVRTSGTIGGNGRLGNGITVQSGGRTAPGNGIGGPGTLTISNSLTLANNVTHRLDISDDPTGTIKTNDLIQVFGTLSVTGTNYIRVNLLDGPLADGVYPLFKYTALSGSLANFVLINANGVLTNPPGMIAIHVDNIRTPATVQWRGDGVNNTWDQGVTANWRNAGSPDVFYFFDSPLFDDSGSNSPAINLVGPITPQSTTFDSTKNYTVSGSGSISGFGPLLKTNSGTLTISSANDYAASTILGGGILSIGSIANVGLASPIGAPDDSVDNAECLIFTGGTLRYTGGNGNTDRGATFTAPGKFEVTSSGTTLTWNGGLIGAGSLQKSGAGTLTLTANNTFTGGTVVSNGTLALLTPTGGASITANNHALGSGPVTLYGGTLKLFGGGQGDAGAGYGTFSRPIEVPTNATATLLTPARYTMNSKLTGGGTLNLEVNYVRGTLNGNWSEFTGTINITAATAEPGIGEFRVANSSGYAGATLFVNNGARITQSGSATIMEIGALGGNAGGDVGPGNSTSSGRSFRVGWNNQNTTFAGQILADGVNVITKVGTGNWTLTGANTYTGGTIVDGGTLTAANASGSATGTGSLTVNTGATLAGTGIISGATTINSGATNSPGNGGIGTLTINNSVTLAAGSTTRIEINKTSATKDLLDASGALTYGGTLIVTNLSGTLAEGDSFKIFDGGSYGGSFSAMVLPTLAANVMWNTTALNTSGTISVVSTNFTIPQSLLWAGDGIANVWNTTTSNWLSAGLPRAFANGDTVTFTNTGSVSPAINLTVSAAPAAMVVNSSQSYTLTGTGALTGGMSLNKSGSGRFTFANTGVNTFSGSVTISAGSVQIGDGVSVNGNLPGNIVNNATLIFANPNAQTWSSVFAGSGTLVKQAAGTLTVSSTNSSYAGNVLIGGGAITLGTGAALNTGSLTLSNGGTFNFPPSSPAYFYPGAITVSSSQTGTVHSPALGNGVNGNLISGNSSSVVNISSGVSFGASTTTQFDSFTGTINILPGATLRFSPNSSGNTYGSLNPLFTINGTLQPRNAGNTVRLGKISGSGTLSGPQSAAGTGNTTYQIGGANVDSTFNGVISSNAAIVSAVVLHKVGTGRLTLSGDSTYTGGTIISNGAVFVNNLTGSGTGSGAVAVRSGTTLGGNGFIGSATTIESGATLAPGDSIGKLTFNSTLTLVSGCTSRLELNATTSTNDTVKTVGAITHAGTLVVSNTAGTLAAGQSFKLFEATGYSGSFSSITLPTLGANLAWTNRLATDGTIAVFSTAPATPPVFNSMTTVGSNLVMSGTNGPANGNYYLLSSTNVSLPMANWSRIATNQFNASGNFNLTNPINPATPQLFYRLQLP